MKKEKMVISIFSVAVFMMTFILSSHTANANPPQKDFTTPNNMRISIEEIGPVTQTTDLQIIFALKHDPQGDKYIEAMQDFNNKQGNLLSTLRERGEFIGDLGETLLYTPPARSIAPKKILLIGIGDANSLSLDAFRVGGRIAVREAVRLGAKNVSWAPTMRDQGSNVIDVGEGDAAVAEQVILAYDTEMRLQQQGLAPASTIDSWTIEAGPKYFDGAVAKVGAIIPIATEELKGRNSNPYVKS